MVGTNLDTWLDRLREAYAEVERVRAEGPAVEG
jgi:hypothetical protein